MTSSATKTSLFEAIEEHRKALDHLQKVVDGHLSKLTDEMLRIAPPVSSVFAMRRATAIQTHLDSARYSVNAAMFYARDAEEHDAD